jgi:hypothetical protein
MQTLGQDQTMRACGVPMSRHMARRAWLPWALGRGSAACPLRRCQSVAAAGLTAS